MLDKTHENVSEALYFIAQVFYDILDTLGQTDEDTQEKLKMLFMLFDANNPKFKIITQELDEDEKAAAKNDVQ